MANPPPYPGRVALGGDMPTLGKLGVRGVPAAMWIGA